MLTAKMRATDGRGGLRMPVIAAKLVAAAARGGATPTRPRWWRRRGAMPIARHDSGWRVRHLAWARSLLPGRCDWRRARCGHRPLADHPMPGRRRQLRHHECRGPTVEIFEHLQQCQPRRASSSSRPNLPQFPHVAAVSLRQAQFAEQPRGRMVGDPEPPQATPGGRSRRPGSSSRIHICQWWSGPGADRPSGSRPAEARSQPPEGVREATAGPPAAVASDTARGGDPIRHLPSGTGARWH